MSNLRNMWMEGIQELENSRMYCTNNNENNNEMDGVEVIDLCSVSQSKNDTLSEEKESAKQESRDKSKHDGTDKMETELETVESNSTTKHDKVESAMMCWEPTSNLSEEKPHTKINNNTKWSRYLMKKNMKMRKLWSPRKWSCRTLEKTFS